MTARLPTSPPTRSILPPPVILLFAGVTGAVLLVSLTGLFNAYGDVARHIRVGEYILQHRTIPQVDVFSYTKHGERFIPSEWLSEVLFAAAYGARGLAAVTIFSAIVIAASCAGVYALIRRQADALRSFTGGLAAAALTATHWSARPHIFTFAGAVLLLFLLQQAGRLRNVGVFALFVLWANLHGGFLYGLVMVAVFGAGKILDAAASGDGSASSTARQVGMTFSAAMLGSAVNPAGLKLHTHLLSYFRESYLVDHTREFLSPNFHLPYTLVFLASLVLIVSAFGVVNKRISYTTLLVLIVNVYFSLYSRRNIPLFGLMAVPLLLIELEPAWRNWRATFLQRARSVVETGESRGRVLPWMIGVGVVLLVLGAGRGEVFGVRATPNEFDASIFPVRAVAHAREAKLSGRILNKQDWGGYLLLAWPEQPVFLDGQTDFYGEELVRTHDQIMDMEPGWRAALAEANIDVVIVPTKSKLAAALISESAWSLWYQDTTASIYLRRHG